MTEAHVPLVTPFPNEQLLIVADTLNDLEKVWLANSNRLGTLTRSTEDSDGYVRGHGLPEDHPVVLTLGGIVDALNQLVKEVSSEVEQAVKKHPLGPWIKSTRGVGFKQGARMIAALSGDPYVNLLTGEPRTVSQLWRYCGLDVLPFDPEQSAVQATIDARGTYDGAPQTTVPGHVRPDTQMIIAGDRPPGSGHAPKRTRGQKNTWNPDARMRAYLIGAKCVQVGGPYREVYDQRRAHTAVTRPEWTPGHSHNDGIRVASKAMLRDMWREAKRLHEND